MRSPLSPKHFSLIVLLLLLATISWAETSYQKIWQVESQVEELDLVSSTISAQEVGSQKANAKETLWALRTSPPAFLRLGNEGKILETVPFTPPRSQNLESSYRPLVVLSSGFGVAEHRFDRQGKPLLAWPFNQAFDLAAGQAQEIFGVGYDGLKRFDESGRVSLRIPEVSFTLDLFQDLRRVDARGDSVAVASAQHIWLLDRAGTITRKLTVPADQPSRRINDLGLDGHGRLVVSLVNPPQAHILGLAQQVDSNWPVEAEIAESADRLAVAADGSFYTLNKHKITYYQPTESAYPAAASSSAETSTSRDVRPVALMESPKALRLHLRNAPIRDLVADPRHPEILWAGGTGGVLQIDTEGKNAPGYKKWTLLEGLPEHDVIGLAFDKNGHLIAFSNDESARLDPQKARFEKLSRLPIKNVRRVIRTAEKDIWLLSQRRLVRFQPSAQHTAPFVELPALQDAVELSGGDWGLVNKDGIYRWFPGQDAELIAAFDEIPREFREAIGLRQAIRPGRLSLVGQEWWIGTANEGFLIYDTSSGAWSQPTWNERVEQTCDRPWLLLQDGRQLVVSNRCFGEIRNGDWFPAREDLEVHAVLPDRDSSSVFWLGTHQGVARLVTRADHAAVLLRWFRPKSEPLAPKPMHLWSAGGRLWTMGSPAHGLSVFELKKETWHQFPKIVADFVLEQDNQVLVAAPGQRCWEGPEMHWLDRESLSVLRRDCSLDRLMRGVQGMAVNDSALWAIGESTGDDTWILGSVDGDQISRWPIGGEKEEPTSLIPDPSQASIFWLVVDDELRRFDTRSGTWEGIQEEVRSAYAYDQQHLWINGYDSGLLDLETLELTTISITERLLPDPSDSSKGWGIDGRWLRQVDVASGGTLQLWRLPPQGRWSSLALLDDRIFVSSWEGILEIRRNLVTSSF